MPLVVLCGRMRSVEFSRSLYFRDIPRSPELMVSGFDKEQDLLEYVL